MGFVAESDVILVCDLKTETEREILGIIGFDLIWSQDTKRLACNYESILLRILSFDRSLLLAHDSMI